MPWKTTADVARHNKAAAKSPKKARQWRTIANKLLAEGKPEGQAIREASGAVRSKASKLYGKK